MVGAWFVYDGSAMAITSVVERAREFLTKNKIFFETITATSLAVMGALLSIASLRNSLEQTRQEKIKSQPLFAVQAGAIFNDATKKYDDIVVTVRDVGSPMQSFTEELHSFLYVRTIYPFPGKEQVTELAVTGYLPISRPTGDATGLLCTLSGYRNNALLADLDRATYTLAKAKGGFAQVSVGNLLEVSYTDLFGTPNHLYFNVNEFGGRPISKQDADALISISDKQIKTAIHFELSTAKPEDLLRAASFPL